MTPAEPTLVILISGRGSNMEAIVRAAQAEAWPVRLAGVVANRPDAAGLRFAQQAGLATAVVDHRSFAQAASPREAFDAALAKQIDALAGGAPSWIALAGFMRVLGSNFVTRYAHRLVNIHPSLLPAFAGLKTHERALAAGCCYAGATVHLVTAELDHGPIAAQASVAVLPDDTAQTLAARVLQREHVMYPRVLKWLITQRLVLQADGRMAQLDGEPLQF